MLKSSVILTPSLTTIYGTSTLYGKTYEVDLPDDYLHILNCVVEYKVASNSGCFKVNDIFNIGAKKLTSDMWSQVVSNYYTKPTYKNPYFFINNVTTTSSFPTVDSKVAISDITPDKLPDTRYGNASKVRMEIRYGNNSIFVLDKVYVDYLKTPKYIKLTQEEIDDIEDNSQLIEFQDYVCQEIINELTKLLLENASDPRLQTNIPINQTIAGQPQQRR